MFPALYNLLVENTVNIYIIRTVNTEFNATYILPSRLLDQYLSVLIKVVY